MIFIVQCPACKQKMKYQPREGFTLPGKKTCVYCNRHFTVNRETIVSKT